MKCYRDNPLASMSLSIDHHFVDALHRHVAPAGIDTVIESGTYLGLGSTTTIAEFFSATGSPKRFLTMEVNWRHFQQARANLKRFLFVDCRWGCSVYRSDALHFIRTDEAIANHRAYPDIWIDDVQDPVAFYTAEIEGTMVHQLSAGNHAPPEANFLWDGEGLLARACAGHKRHRPLIILDSAGGIGLLEFRTVVRAMGNEEYMLLLDDIHHLKHFRSFQAIQADPQFSVLDKDLTRGWALALHRQM